MDWTCVQVPETPIVQIILVISITLIYTWTAISGVEKGIKAVSDLNLILVVVLLVGSFLFGPTVKILRTFVEGIGLYIQNRSKFIGSWCFWRKFMVW